jgi:hypothetical protein
MDEDTVEIDPENSTDPCVTNFPVVVRSVNFAGLSCIAAFITLALPIEKKCPVINTGHS